jgi:D-glycero-alpha-D-manno-heptose-7-phosphate kinase
MIITRTPFRISFFGGGTDLPDWFSKKNGAVISTTIDKYCYVMTRYLPPFFDYNFRLRYFKKEEVKSIDQIKHPSIRECLRYLNFKKKRIEIVHNADLPALSGLGSSSTFTVSLLHSLYALKDKMITKKELALEAIHIEQEILKEKVGSQDQTAAAFGGTNYIEFKKNKGVVVNQIFLNTNEIEKIEKNFFLIYTGIQRKANLVSRSQVNNIINSKNDIYLQKILDLTKQAYEEIFLKKKIDLKNFGEALNIQWDLKKRLSNSVSSDYLNNIYDLAINSGSLGGKLLGAGGGGFFLFLVENKNKKKFLKSFKNFLHVPFRPENTGSQIIYHSR